MVIRVNVPDELAAQAQMRSIESGGGSLSNTQSPTPGHRVRVAFSN